MGPRYDPAAGITKFMTGTPPILGTAATLCLIMAGQLLGALLIDQFGILGLATRQVTFGRAAGAVIVVVGALMVRLL